MLDGRTLVRKGSIVLNNTSRSCVSLLEEGDNRLLHAGEEEDKRLLHAGQEQDKRLLHAGEEGDKLSINMSRTLSCPLVPAVTENNINM